MTNQEHLYATRKQSQLLELVAVKCCFLEEISFNFIVNLIILITKVRSEKK